MFDISNVKDGFDPEANYEMGTYSGLEVFSSSVSFGLDITSNNLIKMNMMKTNKYIIVLISTALFSLTGCTDWLEQEPMSQVTTAVYFKKC